MAALDCAQIGGIFQGQCDSSCSDGWMSYPGGNSECAGNYWDDICCVEDPNADITPPSDTCAGGNGECQAGWCSNDSVEDPSYNDDCSGNIAEKICCVTSDAPPSDTCAGGNGECQAGWCSGDLIEDSSNNYECAGNIAEKICCVGEGGNNDEEGSTNEEGSNDDGNAINGTDITIPNVGLPDPAGNNPGQSGVQIILISFLDWILIVFLIASVIAFVITGLMYLFAMGNSRSALMDNAKNYFTYAVIAILITGSGLIIVNIVDDFLKGTL
ncbi:MAG: hypothetical protein PF549_05005 [Patescibacteria group bacterium]|nr:hypothetical protein [Patescibacteria group bacterium]